MSFIPSHTFPHIASRRSSVVVISKEALAELEERLQLHSTPNKLPMQIYRFMPEVAAAAIEEAKATAVAIASAQI
eukprot:6174298-Pleurochrysis_carterae.AAC.3